MGRFILRNMIMLTLVAVILSSTLTLIAVYRIFNENTREELRHDAAFIVELLQGGHSVDALKQMDAFRDGRTRMTLVGLDGEVAFDTWVDENQMDNHQQRQEVRQALDTGVAESFRLSHTLGTQTFYYAVLLDDQTVLRLAKTTDSAVYTLYRLLSLIGLIIGGVVVVAFFLASRMVEGVLTPINQIDLDSPLDNDTYDELAPLLGRISKQNEAIRQQLVQLEQHQEEFDAITGHMAEGLIILDSDLHIVSLNSSALRILGNQSESTKQFSGRSILTLNRSLTLQETLQQGLGGQRSETVLPVADRSYQVFVNPVFASGAIRGVIVLFLDITEKYAVEQMRREFSGNVSHELKTPLTSISSYAELLKNDMVQPVDIQPFSQHIYDETQRMIALVDDILKLSRLDERVELGPSERVCLLQLSETAAERLGPLASQRNVQISVTGLPVSVLGDRAILFEMIYNLCHNAVKYSRSSGGKVTVSCSEDEGAAVVEVADDGIGIPRKYQERVFERFYRVDTSHSKQTGGTGLGLSIVKHAAAYHGADISLTSAENAGTVVAVRFPRIQSAIGQE